MTSKPAKDPKTGRFLPRADRAGAIPRPRARKTGRFKVFATAGDWFEEFRLYHRKDGRIVKERDDVISASRYALMMKRFARVKSDSAAWAFTDRKVL